MSEPISVSADSDILIKLDAVGWPDSPDSDFAGSPLETASEEPAAGPTAHDMPVPLSRHGGVTPAQGPVAGAPSQTASGNFANAQAGTSRSFTALLKSVESRRGSQEKVAQTAPPETVAINSSAMPQGGALPEVAPASSEPFVSEETQMHAKQPREMPLPEMHLAEERWDEIPQAGSAVGRKWIQLGVLMGAIVLAALGAYFWVSHNTPRPTVAAAPAAGTAVGPEPQPDSPLGLSVELREKGLLSIRWNAAATPVKNAGQGRLVILERDQPPQLVDLTPAQLRGGHIYYQTPMDRVEFRLEITDAAGNITHESFLALSRTPAAMPGTVPAANATAVHDTNVAAPFVVAQPEVRVAQAVPVSTPEKTRPRVFLAPVSTAARAVYLEAPADNVTVPTLPLTLGGAENLMPNAVAPPPPQAPLAQSSPSQGRMGSVKSASLVKKVAPIYPAMARQTRVQGIVRLNVTIGKDGMVRNLQVLNGHPLLTPAAVAAVKQWVYSPSLVDGQAQEVVTQVEVNFTLNN